ncbi:MAG: phosphoribosylformylglycinamidine synthase, partial [Spirochaetaceae bacterium]|nr:phosphoribosylformylglycinamidine synthase [Spirochaetaceae bacterium]
MFRIYIERKAGFTNEANRIFSELTHFLGVSGLTGVRYLNRYDISGIDKETLDRSVTRVFSEPQSDVCYYDDFPRTGDDIPVVQEYLPGQYDQRSDSAEQCLSLLAVSGSSPKVRTEPKVRSAKVVVLTGKLSADDINKVKKYLINPVDSREGSLLPADAAAISGAKADVAVPAAVPVITGFIGMNSGELDALYGKLSLAMDRDDFRFLHDYFSSVQRDPTETEIRVLDTYWSDHCRHTTFNTVLTDIEVEEGPFSADIRESLEGYRELRDDLYSVTTDRPITLMDMVVIGAKYLKKQGFLDDIELSEEINACSIYIDVCTESDTTERWLLMFKNETHNHPTEIEPFGGAATCIGGAIRDPLSGRAWVYQSMRVTGAADPRAPLSETLPGKLPQLKLVRE